MKRTIALWPKGGGLKLCDADDMRLLRTAIQSHDALVEACEKLLELAKWMSGSGDFAPDGKAYKGWLSMRNAISEGQAALTLTGGTSE